MLTNFKKDSEIHKTRDYCKKKLEGLETLWTISQSNDMALQCDSGKGDEYYTSNKFAQMQLTYNQLKWILRRF
jgi:hypothetical protein